MLKNSFGWLLFCVIAVHAGPPPVPVSPIGPFDMFEDENFSPPPKLDPHPVEGILFQGDIQIAGRKIGQAGTTRVPWPNGVIPYRFDCSVENIPSAIKASREAMQEWENRTCIRFVEKRPEDKAFLEFFRAAGCWATYVGYRKDTKTQISIGSGCEFKHVMVHELGHVIGFWHEQSRTDRNDYIKINLGNVHPSLRYNFDIVKEQTNSYGEAYDYGSIMHYPWKAFAIDRRYDTIIPIQPLNGKQPYVKLSDSDVAQTRKMYKCGGSSTSSCVDLHRNCKTWADLGFCDLEPDPMLAICRKSCGNCGPCVDENTNCQGWASYGYCLKLPKHMLKHCKESCGICRRAPTKSPHTTRRPTVKPTTRNTDRKSGEKFTGTKCVDRSQYCGDWKKNGRCKTDRWVQDNCLLSCERYDICDAEEIKPTGACTSSLGIGWKNKLPDANFFGSSTFRPGGGWYAAAYRGRLYLEDNHKRKEIGGWCAQPGSKDQYLQINLAGQKKITAVATQGRDRYFEHVKSYTLSFSGDGRTWRDYMENGKKKVFDGNCDHFTPVLNILGNWQVAGHIRFHPVTFIGAMCLRVEVYGCSYD